VTDRAACVFCRIVDHAEPASYLAEEGDAIAFLDSRFPDRYRTPPPSTSLAEIGKRITRQLT